LAAFLVKTSAGQLARPEGVFELDAVAPKGYRLLAGADVTRGHARYAATCAECHGSDGTKIEIDETLSAGSISRTSGYEIWFKLQHGHPGSNMKRQVSEATGAANSQGVLELLAALCDRSKYPALAGQSDVPDGDARCGGYLK
jgi:mono/diheme cytochrome c family protein